MLSRRNVPSTMIGGNFKPDEQIYELPKCSIQGCNEPGTFSAQSFWYCGKHLVDVVNKYNDQQKMVFNKINQELE